MTAIVIVMVLIVVVALVVISVFSEEDGDPAGPSRDRAEPDEAHLDDLLR